MRHISKLILLPILFVIAACSNQYRDADPDVDEATLLELIADISAQNLVGASGGPSIDELLEDPYAVIYEAASSEWRPASSVISMLDVEALFPGSYSSLDYVDAVAIFIDAETVDGRFFALLTRVTDVEGNTFYFSRVSAADAYTFDDEIFEVTLPGVNDGEVIVLRSTDLSPNVTDTLGPAIKLEVWVENDSETYKAGQISTMASFGG